MVESQSRRGRQGRPDYENQDVNGIGRREVLARPPRVERAGGGYHLTGRGNARLAIARENRDPEPSDELLSELVARFRARLHGFVLLDTDDHLLV